MPASIAPTSTASKVIVVVRQGPIGEDGLLSTWRVSAALRVRNAACGTKTLMTTRMSAAWRVTGSTAEIESGALAPAAIHHTETARVSIPLAVQNSPTTPTRNCSSRSGTLRGRKAETGCSQAPYARATAATKDRSPSLRVMIDGSARGGVNPDVPMWG